MPLRATGTTAVAVPVREASKGSSTLNSSSRQLQQQQLEGKSVYNSKIQSPLAPTGMEIVSGEDSDPNPVGDVGLKIKSSFSFISPDSDIDSPNGITRSRNGNNNLSPPGVGSSNSSDSGSSYDEKKNDLEPSRRFDVNDHANDDDQINFPDAGFAFSATTQIMKMFGTQLANNNKTPATQVGDENQNNLLVNSAWTSTIKQRKMQNENDIETSSQSSRISRNSASQSNSAVTTCPRTPEKATCNSSMGTGTPKKKGSYPKFIEKLKQPAASDVARSIRVFVSNFEKRIASKNAQIEITNPNNSSTDADEETPIINAKGWGGDEEDVFNADRMPGEDNEDATCVQQFLRKLEQQVRLHPSWKNCNHTEWENTVEGLERFVVKRIYDIAFVPTPQELIRRRDMILKNRIKSLRFLHPGHLGSAIITNRAETDLWEDEWNAAAAELNKINKFKAPRDKVVCILNCCRIVARLLRSAMNAKNDESALPGTGEGADDLIPALIYTVIVANPDNLYSNIEFVAAYRNPNGFKGEAGYFFTILTSAVSFIQTLTADVLTGISEEEFNAGIETCLNLEANENGICANADVCLDDHKKEQVLRNDSHTIQSDHEDIITYLKFMDMEAENLTLSQVPELLKEYKHLAAMCENLQRELSTSKSSKD
mmetsp:Transcript_35588/g.44045  ORF Transcript_35588/g.44045 Transcript_35588/m.44045 type:complete len:656 (+) Transcript_35588:619-2586(+)